MLLSCIHMKQQIIMQCKMLWVEMLYRKKNSFEKPSHSVEGGITQLLGKPLSWYKTCVIFEVQGHVRCFCWNEDDDNTVELQILCHRIQRSGCWILQRNMQYVLTLQNLCTEFTAMKRYLKLFTRLMDVCQMTTTRIKYNFEITSGVVMHDQQWVL